MGAIKSYRAEECYPKKTLVRQGSSGWFDGIGTLRGVGEAHKVELPVVCTVYEPVELALDDTWVITMLSGDPIQQVAVKPVQRNRDRTFFPGTTHLQNLY
jgi:hypothetical protein